MVNNTVGFFFLVCSFAVGPYLDVDRLIGKSQLRWLGYASGHTSTKNWTNENMSTEGLIRSWLVDLTQVKFGNKH